MKDVTEALTAGSSGSVMEITPTVDDATPKVLAGAKPSAVCAADTGTSGDVPPAENTSESAGCRNCEAVPELESSLPRDTTGKQTKEKKRWTDSLSCVPLKKFCRGG